MTGLRDIGVKVVPASEDSGALTIPARAVLHELAALLERLVESGEGGSIDLRSLPLGPGDYERLAAFLGQGEVSAVVEALGPTRVRETAVRGVWWVTHCNTDEEVVAELLEVTRCPVILETQPDDAHASLAELRARLRETTEGGTGAPD